MISHSKPDVEEQHIANRTWLITEQGPQELCRSKFKGNIIPMSPLHVGNTLLLKMPLSPLRLKRCSILADEAC